MPSDVSIAILSAIKPPLPDCVRAVYAQLGGPYRVFLVRDTFPMHAAFNEMIFRSAPSRFVVQVDGDVALHVGAVEALYTEIKNKPWLYMAWGQLWEDGFGVGGAVRIWRRWPARFFRFRDRRCVDRDYHARIRWTGMRRQQVKWFGDPGQPFGTHYPRSSGFARYSKAKGDVQKWRFLGRHDLISQHAPGPQDLDACAGFTVGLQQADVGHSKNAQTDWVEYQVLKERR